jgi:mannose-6-phosphate isomerase
VSTAPYPLTPLALEKIWGTADTQPWWESDGKKIGEVWFRENEEVPELLMKFIFTSEHLSVQVHPDDDYAKIHHNSPGKTEMWHILRAEPGSVLALGLKEKLTPERLREVSLSGEIENLLNWIEVHPGDTVFVPAGTIHAIGAGLVVCEIQQPSDVTYRLFDYGRPRELHLDQSVAVADAGPAPVQQPPLQIAPNETRLAACSKFVTDRIEINAPIEYQPEAGKSQFLIVLDGAGTIAGQPFQAGQAWRVPAGSTKFSITPKGRAVMLRTFVP